jgi:hypothetical protein
MKGVLETPTGQRNFSEVVTYMKKTGVLLIEVFRKHLNAQNYGHLGSVLGGLLLFVRISKNFAFQPS